MRFQYCLIALSAFSATAMAISAQPVAKTATASKDTIRRQVQKCQPATKDRRPRIPSQQTTMSNSRLSRRGRLPSLGSGPALYVGVHKLVKRIHARKMTAPAPATRSRIRPLIRLGI